MYLIFDTETTGLPKRWDAPITDTDNWPRCIQIACQFHDEMGNVIENQELLVMSEGVDIACDAEQTHGISTELAEKEGISLTEGSKRFKNALEKTKFIVGHDGGFDVNVMGAEFHRAGISH